MKNVLITGASGGIGSAMAEVFADNGYNVVIHYNKNRHKAEELLNRLREKNTCSAMTVQADLSSYESIKEMSDQIKNNFSHIDIIINNAAVSVQGLFTDITNGQWDNIFNVNVRGAFYCIREFIPEMISRKYGNIINIASMWGETGASCETAYSASKSALIGMTKALAKEVGPSGIRVNCISPGVIDTDMNSVHSEETMLALRDETPLGRIGHPSDIAQLALFLASDDAGFITGQVVGCNGGFLI